MCAYCGRSFRNERLVEIKGKRYCKNDLDEVFDKNKNSSKVSLVTEFNITNTKSNVNTN